MGVPNCVARTHVATPSVASGGAAYVGTKIARGVPTWVVRTHVITPSVASGGAPFYGGTKRVGCADMGGADACERTQCGLGWSPLLWGHETCGVYVLCACRHGWQGRM
eukprot:5969167-Pyramimonas_sp.AAC.1